MPMARVAAEHYEPDTVGDARKACINLLSEPDETDPNRPMRHILRPGSLDLDPSDVLQNVPRGIAQVDGHADGKILIVDGSTVRTVTSSGSWGALSGSIAGNDRAQFAFAETQAAILSGGRIFISDGSTVTEESDPDYELQLSNIGETGFSSIASIGQRLLFTVGPRWGWSDTLNFGSTSTTYFLTTEDSPDTNVAVTSLNSRVYVFGTQTIQVFSQTGGEGAAAFRPQTGSTIDRGCLARDTIVQMDNTLFWVGEDFSVYRLSGLTPMLISKPWISKRLKLEDPADLVASKMEFDGHSLYKLSGRLGEYVFDNLTQKWVLWRSYGEDTFEFGQTVTVRSEHFAISRFFASAAKLGRNYETDFQPGGSNFGTEIVWELSAHLPVMGGREKIVSIRIDGTKGRGSSADVNQDAIIAMALSKDNGRTRSNYRDRSTGRQGKYKKRSIWRRNGRTREPQVIAFFRSNDPHIINAVAVNED